MILTTRLAINNDNEIPAVAADDTLYGGELLTSVGYKSPRVSRG
jgi:hypothetical protein